MLPKVNPQYTPPHFGIYFKKVNKIKKMTLGQAGCDFLGSFLFRGLACPINKGSYYEEIWQQEKGQMAK